MYRTPVGCYMRGHAVYSVIGSDFVHIFSRYFEGVEYFRLQDPIDWKLAAQERHFAGKYALLPTTMKIVKTPAS